MALPIRINPPTTPSVAPAPGGALEATEAWQQYHQGMSDRLTQALERIAVLEARLLAAGIP